MSMTSLKVKKPDLRVMSGKLEESINNARFDGTEIKLLVSSNKSRIHAQGDNFLKSTRERN